MKKQKQKKKMSLLLKIVILMSSFMMFLDLVFGVGMMTRSIYKMKSIIQGKVMEIAYSAAQLVNGDEIEALTKDDKANNTEPYVKNYNILQAFKTSNEDNNADLAFIYCLVKTDDGKIVFSIDPSYDTSIFLEEEIEYYTKAVIKAFDEGIGGFDDVSYVDRWGDLYTGYAPVFASDGHVAAVVGVDVWASWYKKEITHNAISIGLLSFVTIILGVGFAIILTNSIRNRFDRLSFDMGSLEDDVQELIKDIRDPRYINNIEQFESSQDDTLSQLRDRLHQTQFEIKQYIAYTHEQAYVDILTGLGNRTAYFEKVKTLDVSSYQNKPFQIVVYDINGLKFINDQYGHDNGDVAIQLVGRFIKEEFGDENSYRIGGDELVSIFFDMDEQTLAKKLVSFHERFKKFNNSKNKVVPFELTVSYGHSILNPEVDTSFKDVFHRADEEMYTFKKAYYKATGNKRRII